MGGDMTFVKRMAAGALGAAMVIGAGLSASPARAGYIVTVQQAGNNVVATGSGILDFGSLTVIGTITAGASINPSHANIGTGSTGANGFATAAQGTGSGPTSFGSGQGFTTPNSSSGDFVGMSAGISGFLQLGVPLGYTPDSPLADSSVYDNATLSSLGATPGTYEWTWGTGPNQNFTLIIPGVGAAVPEPSALSQLGVGLAGLALAGFWRSRRRT
jgi:MYXO-CTERM domain-containing protein